MKKIAIIGAGYTGLSIAKKIIENKKEKYQITIFEQNKEVGGMVRTVCKCGTYLDRHYRHIFKSDKYIINLAKEFGIEIIWPETKMGYFTQNKIFEFGTPISLLKFKPLDIYSKIKFGISIIILKLKKNWKKIENITVQDYIIKKYGENVYKTVWEPLLIAKFGKKKSEISMAWLWGKISLRSTSSSFNGEQLGYIKGSYKVLTDALYKFLLHNNCEIYLDCKINKVFKYNNKYSIKANNFKNVYNNFDYVISTASNIQTADIYDECLLNEEKIYLTGMEYSLAKTLIIISKKQLSKFYWINIGEATIPFGGIIEQTNLLSKENYQNFNIIYISNYMFEDDDLYKLNREELFEVYFPFLKKINPDFEKSDVLDIIISEDKFAQPIIKTNYSKQKLSFEFNQKGLYMANMSQIYPEDRGMNYAVRLGYNIADEIINS